MAVMFSTQRAHSRLARLGGNEGFRLCRRLNSCYYRQPGEISRPSISLQLPESYLGSTQAESNRGGNGERSRGKTTAPTLPE